MKPILKRLKSKTYRAAIVGAALVIIEHNSGFFSAYLPESVRQLAVLFWPLLMITLREFTSTPVSEK